MTNYEIRSRARDFLKNNWLVLIISYLVVSIVGVCVAYIPPFFSSAKVADAVDTVTFSNLTVDLGGLSFGQLLWCFIISPFLSLGLARMYLAIQNRTVEFSEVLGGFPYFIKAFLTSLLRIIFSAGWGIFAIGIPYALFALLLGGIGKDIVAGGSAFGGLTSLFIMLAFLAALAAIWLAINKIMNFALTTYILADDEDIAPRAAIRRSKKLMKGNKKRLFALAVGFLGWILLAAACGYILAIPFLKLIPNETLARISSSIMLNIPIAIVSVYWFSALGVFYRRVSDEELGYIETQEDLISKFNDENYDLESGIYIDAEAEESAGGDVSGGVGGEEADVEAEGAEAETGAEAGFTEQTNNEETIDGSKTKS